MNYRALLLASCVAAASFVTGCATPIRPQVLVPPITVAEKSFPGSVEVAVSGIVTTPNVPLLDLNIFRTALKDAVRQSQLFRGGLLESGGDYLLDVNILSTEWPGPGISMTTTFTIRWKLTRKSTGEVLCDDITRTSHTKTLGDAFVGMTRARHSIEGAARDAIADGLKTIAKNVR